MKAKRLSAIIITFWLYSLTTTAAVTLSEKEQNSYRSSIKLNCEKIKTESNKKEICSCIAENHLRQIQFSQSEKQARGQLQWVSDFYAKKISQKEFERDPYFVGGVSGILMSFDDDCSFDPSYIVTFPE